MKKIIVFVTGFETDPNKGAISGWDWWVNIKDADSKYKEYLQLEDVTPYRGKVEIEVPIDLDILSENGIEYVNNEVELFLSENDWENAFLTK